MLRLKKLESLDLGSHEDTAKLIERLSFHNEELQDQKTSDNRFFRS